MELSEEAKEATALLKGKVVSEIIRNRSGEVLIEFTDGTRIFINQKPDGLEMSIT